MHICLSGAHRTGKTTTAKLLAARLGYKFVHTGISSMPVWDMIGSGCNHYTFAERVQIQRHVLDHLTALHKQFDNDDNVVFDRSVIDLVGYLETNFDNTASSLFDKQVTYLLNDIQRLCFFTKCVNFIVQPHSQHEYVLCDVDKNDKVYNSLAYRQSITDVICGYSLRNAGIIKYHLLPKEKNAGELVDIICDILATDQTPFVPDLPPVRTEDEQISVHRSTCFIKAPDNGMKETTKYCPKCGNTNLFLFTSTNRKICQSCPGNNGETLIIPWYLEPGQKSVF